MRENLKKSWKLKSDKNGWLCDENKSLQEDDIEIDFRTDGFDQQDQKTGDHPEEFTIPNRKSNHINDLQRSK